MLEIIAVCYNAKKRWLEWQFNVVAFAEVLCVAEISGFNKPKNDLIRICEFCHASFLGSVPSKTATCCKMVEKNELKPKL